MNEIYLYYERLFAKVKGLDVPIEVHPSLPAGQWSITQEAVNTIADNCEELARLRAEVAALKKENALLAANYGKVVKDTNETVEDFQREAEAVNVGLETLCSEQKLVIDSLEEELQLANHLRSLAIHTFTEDYYRIHGHGYRIVVQEDGEVKFVKQ